MPACKLTTAASRHCDKLLGPTRDALEKLAFPHNTLIRAVELHTCAGTALTLQHANTAYTRLAYSSAKEMKLMSQMCIHVHAYVHMQEVLSSCSFSVPCCCAVQ